MLFQRFYGMSAAPPAWMDVINKGDTGQPLTDDEYAYHTVGLTLAPEALLPRRRPTAKHLATDQRKLQSP